MLTRKHDEKLSNILSTHFSYKQITIKKQVFGNQKQIRNSGTGSKKLKNNMIYGL